MELIRQPSGSSVCGQACVAMLCNVTLEEVITLLQSKGGTRTRQLVLALKHYHSSCENRLRRGFPKCETAILRFTHPDGKSHWVVWHNRKFYDPVSGVHRKVPRWLEGSRITSHLYIGWSPIFSSDRPEFPVVVGS